MDETRRPSLLARCIDGTPRDRASSLRWLGLVTLWAICFVAATFALTRPWAPSGLAAWAVAMLPTVVGVVMVLAYVRYLRDTDELQRQIQLYALAVGFGATWLAIAGYPLLERAGAPAADVSDYSLVMAVSFVLGLLATRRRFR